MKEAKLSSFISHQKQRAFQITGQDAPAVRCCPFCVYILLLLLLPTQNIYGIYLDIYIKATLHKWWKFDCSARWNKCSGRDVAVPTPTDPFVIQVTPPATVFVGVARTGLKNETKQKRKSEGKKKDSGIVETEAAGFCKLKLGGKTSAAAERNI